MCYLQVVFAFQAFNGAKQHMKILPLGLLIFLSLLTFPAMANDPHAEHGGQRLPAPDEGTVALTLFPERGPAAGTSVRVVAQITYNGKPIPEDDLQTVHTQKFHLLAIDPTFTDYQHIHPQPTATPGSYLFTFTPKLDGGYRAWAEITLRSTGKHYFAWADMGKLPAVHNAMHESYEAVVDGYRFELSFDETPTVGGESMGSVTISDAGGKPVTSLEPVMGAVAHIVGFYDDYQMVAHTHPMGEEPKGDDAHGGPELMFHLAPEKLGFMRLFAQVRIGGKDIYAPFGIVIK